MLWKDLASAEIRHPRSSLACDAKSSNNSNAQTPDAMSKENWDIGQDFPRFLPAGLETHFTSVHQRFFRTRLSFEKWKETAHRRR